MDGWSWVKPPQEQLRPVFDIAIGISTGAMMVTHAFLGSDYDHVLREQVATLTTEDVFRTRSILAAMFGDSATDSSPLRRRLEQSITRETLDKVADAWLNEGRRLAVIAVDFDYGNPETLDLTAVALQRDNPARRDRYIDYIMASAASPVAFPPVFIDGHMMVDGALPNTSRSQARSRHCFRATTRGKNPMLTSMPSSTARSKRIRNASPTMSCTSPYASATSGPESGPLTVSP